MTQINNVSTIYHTLTYGYTTHAGGTTMGINDIITINNTMSDKEIRSIFHKAMVAHHPDKGGSHEAMVIITTAWDSYKRNGVPHTYTNHTPSTTPTERMEYYIQRKARYDRLVAESDGYMNRGIRRIKEELDMLEQELGIH